VAYFGDDDRETVKKYKEVEKLRADRSDLDTRVPGSTSYFMCIPMASLKY